ncbi:Tagatose-6-phosphate kinase AgaZ [Rubellimicrobium mesophilum DSM 19309]|uniref:Tagatose-6-phosphate kinase AgaZ n=1 Tax=Rubellimicrobium mesophilum DSM 19309 TaxID=442562 RepID=A0A017HUZ9_9RHOB|nr:class II D-tagatose-bisphosphate aldolase, non-catalytic subunit [Rubellimicrobium mesophilum]EYD77978.1 Tagatose-6-phosphate kinase AgaZ [Rubellimicrobium mesophilum DSM 19309]
MSAILQDVIARNRAGARAAIPSVCSAHPEVIEASLRLARQLGRPIVVEATSNQVNQDGGYTGQTPADFVAMVHKLADKAGLDRAAVVLGGDHLGPQAWRSLAPEEAMAKADAMVRAYAKAGFTKIHLDCSEGCAGEPAQLTDAETVPRAAILARAAVETVPGDRLLFVVGTEVPPPGGARPGDQGITPTSPEAARATLDAHMEAFRDLGRIGGLVVQPGVEFGAMEVHHLPMDRDPGLREAVAHHEGVVLEAHSTDYQRPEAFPRLAELGFAFQKVGPALTFAWREAAYALDSLAQIAGWIDRDLSESMEIVMLADPRHWQRHLDPKAGELRVQRHFSYADRIRYYWPKPEAQAALSRLRAALQGKRLPDPLLRQGFCPAVLDRAEPLRAQFSPADALLQASVQEALAPYLFPDA